MTVVLVKSPIYQQLNDALRSLLAGGGFKAGARFLTEREVSERYEVSRATANKALSNLVSGGLLEFRKGVGTFVRAGLLDYDLRSLVSFTDRAKAAGKRPSTRVLGFERLPGSRVPKPVAAALRLPPEDFVYSVERLRLADGAPVILERRFVVEALCPGLKRADFVGSLYALWTGRFRLEVGGADQSIRAVAVRGAEARRLGVPNGAAGLLVHSIGRLTDRRPLWWERTLYRGDAYAFRARLGPFGGSPGEFIDPASEESL